MHALFPRRVGLCLIIGLALFGPGCASSQLPPSQAADHECPCKKSGQREVRETDSSLIGMWQGFWSLKGSVETERFLFLQDGRWGWLATEETLKQPNPAEGSSADKGAEVRVRPVQRSGRWEIERGVIALTELQRKEIIGCEKSVATERPCESGLQCDRCNPEYRIVQNDVPVVERLTIGECPANREAEQLDSEYLCRMIDGRIFWKKTLPTERERDNFLIGK
jgi:hypothetical protein